MIYVFSKSEIEKIQSRIQNSELKIEGNRVVFPYILHKSPYFLFALIHILEVTCPERIAFHLLFLYTNLKKCSPKIRVILLKEIERLKKERDEMCTLGKGECEEICSKMYNEYPTLAREVKEIEEELTLRKYDDIEGDRFIQKSNELFSFLKLPNLFHMLS